MGSDDEEKIRSKIYSYISHFFLNSRPCRIRSLVVVYLHSLLYSGIKYRLRYVHSREAKPVHIIYTYTRTREDTARSCHSINHDRIFALWLERSLERDK